MANVGLCQNCRQFAALSKCVLHGREFYLCGRCSARTQQRYLKGDFKGMTRKITLPRLLAFAEKLRREGKPLPMRQD